MKRIIETFDPDVRIEMEKPAKYLRMRDWDDPSQLRMTFVFDDLGDRCIATDNDALRMVSDYIDELLAKID